MPRTRSGAGTARQLPTLEGTRPSREKGREGSDPPHAHQVKDWDQKREDAGTSADDGAGQEGGYRTIFVFKRNWFVLSQTDGEPYVPEPIPNWDKAAALLVLNIREENFTMLNGNAQGYATGVATVAVSPVAAMLAKTLYHEITHVILDHYSEGGLNSIHEVEAECGAP